ncbi:hypothetical protein [Rhodococcus tibetensis]|uniref:GAD-related domain-containing protein n=1 Tax=Rhodococcus tibetensis TaxID=2965064 RepID=A0ABT1Q7Y1_9NOCA|nr:hypothetical protein [Rhodococcus sp. FXJ9.536]MCQ4118352.1 hypothetical protein [Rhodococcus sp. FXJ9.536]
MSKATHRNRTEQDFNGPFVTGEHFRHGLPIRRQAQKALADLKPAQMPLLLDALDETATPVFEYLEPFAWVVPEFEEFRASRTIGPTLAWWCKFHGQSAESLLVNTERYFCFGPEGSAIGAIEEHSVFGMYSAYRCTSEATADRHAYYASEEMTALIRAGSKTSAEVSVTPDDLPSPSGVAYLARPEGGLVLLWNILYDTRLSVQLVSAAGVEEFLGDEGELRPGAAYRYINHVYLPIPTAEAELSPPESDTPPSLHLIDGLTPAGMDSDVRQEALTSYRGWTSAEILGVFVSFTHMLRQKTTQTESTTVSAAKSATTRRRKKPSQITYMSYRP